MLIIKNIKLKYLNKKINNSIEFIKRFKKY